MRFGIALGYPCAPGLPDLCDCGSLSVDVGHFHSYRRLVARAVRARHDHVVQTLAGLFRKIGPVVQVEPRIYGVTSFDLILIACFLTVLS